jgi:hypothetical protein
VNVQINAKGEGRYERYTTSGNIQQDENDMVRYKSDQVVEIGEFKLHENDLRRLWQTINENDFFELTGNYHMAIGYSYASIMIEADGRRHQVRNIGMEVPEIRAIVEVANTVLPEGAKLEYGEGHTPWKTSQHSVPWTHSLRSLEPAQASRILRPKRVHAR